MPRLLLLLLLALGGTLQAQVYTPADSVPSWPDGGLERPTYELGKIVDRITVGGYYRFFGWNRALENGFRVLPDNQFANTPPYVIGVGDLYRDPPMILMNFGVRPSSGTYLGMDWAFYSNFTGNPGAAAINLNLGVNINGGFSTDIGRFGFQMGGINWVNVSDFVFGAFQPYERFSVFDRIPWEGVSGSAARADNFFSNGSVSRDARFGMQAFKGVLMDGYELPGNMSFRVLYGKTPATASLEDSVPRFTLGGRVAKSWGKSTLAYNTMNYVIYTDAQATERAGIELHTLSGNWDHEKFQLWAEGGVGRLYQTVDDQEYDEGLRLRFRTRKAWTRFPLEVEVFRLAPEFVNYYGSFLSFNTNIVTGDAVAQTVSGNNGAGSFVGSITDVGQLSNNRQGFSLNAWFDIGENTQLNLGNMVSQEMERITNQLSFGHRINGVAFSRFITFTNNTGPYRRWTSFFRGVSESVFITDVDEEGLPPELLTFNSLQVQLKQRVRWSKLPTYIFYVGSLGSATDDLQMVPAFNDKAYLRTQYHELDVFMSPKSWLDLVFTFGLERIQAGDRTNNIYYIDQDGNLAGAYREYVEGQSFGQYGIPGTQIAGSNYSGAATPAQGFVNQTSTLFGAGFDINISEQAGLYVRHRRFHQLDENYGEDDIQGSETTVELRIQF